MKGRAGENRGGSEERGTALWSCRPSPLVVSSAPNLPPPFPPLPPALTSVRSEKLEPFLPKIGSKPGHVRHEGKREGGRASQSSARVGSLRQQRLGAGVKGLQNAGGQKTCVFGVSVPRRDNYRIVALGLIFFLPSHFKPSQCSPW